LRKVFRYPWAGDDPLYREYHDKEWGVPVHSDKKLFEMLILESFQAGLSWITILKKREHFSRAFAQWDWEKVAAFGKNDINGLLDNAGIIRNRLKILAAVNNASCFMKVRAEFGSFDSYIWPFVGNKPRSPSRSYRSLKEVPTRSPESDTLSADLKKRGFKFVGTVICYSFMQAVGMVNDHIVSCFRRGK
jgi:DNA-3-methyladenine glycosylase I